MSEEKEIDIVEINIEDFKEVHNHNKKNLHKEMIEEKDGTTFCVGINEKKKIVVFASIFHAKYEVKIKKKKKDKKN